MKNFEKAMKLLCWPVNVAIALMFLFAFAWRRFIALFLGKDWYV